MLASLVFLTPLGALVGAAVLLPLAAIWLATRRARAARTALGLQPPRSGTSVVALVALVAVFVLLALAATQPAISHETVVHVRKDAQALFVLDTSRSMAAEATPLGPTRLARAKRIAAELRETIPTVPSGVANFTDRVLPNLLPVAGRSEFNATLVRSVGIEEPPPSSSGLRATSFDALGAIPTSGFFDPSATHRTIVVLTDGESTPFDAEAIGKSLSGVGVVVVHVGDGNEIIFGPSAMPETAYRPDPLAPEALASLAAATGDGRVYGEGDVGAAAAKLQALLGSGPTAGTVARTHRETPLAPFLALAALVPLALFFAVRSVRRVRLTRQ